MSESYFEGQDPLHIREADNAADERRVRKLQLEHLNRAMKEIYEVLDLCYYHHLDFRTEAILDGISKTLWVLMESDHYLRRGRKEK